MDLRERRLFLGRRADLSLHRTICRRRNRSSRKGGETFAVHTGAGTLGGMGGDCSGRVGRSAGDRKATGLTSRTVERGGNAVIFAWRFDERTTGNAEQSPRTHDRREGCACEG